MDSKSNYADIRLDEYIKVVQTDPVWRAGLKLYFDPLTHDFEEVWFRYYLDRFREQVMYLFNIEKTLKHNETNGISYEHG